MRRTSSVSSPCSKVLTSTRSSTAWAAHASTSRRLLNSHVTTTSDTSLHAPPTSEPPFALQFMSASQNFPRNGLSSRRSLISTTFRSEVSTESTQSQLMPLTTSPTSADSVAQRESSSKTCTMVSRPWSTRRSPCEDISSQVLKIKNLPIIQYFISSNLLLLTFVNSLVPLSTSPSCETWLRLERGELLRRYESSVAVSIIRNHLKFEGVIRCNYWNAFTLSFRYCKSKYCNHYMTQILN